MGKRLPQDEAELLPARVVEIFKTMGRETEIRGEQAGGGAIFARDRANQAIFVGEKVVNQKRRNLTQSLESAFSKTRRKAAGKGAKASDEAVVGIWHYRFATSSAPAVLETHWHEWMPARFANVWRVEAGKWICDRLLVNHRITHNGDFDGWTIFDDTIENAELGLWLQRVLHTPNAALGDSPKIAGMMDLLITQGMWDASLRLAYQMAVAESTRDACGGKTPTKDAPNTAPTEAQIQNWSTIVEKVFLDYQDKLLMPYANSMLELSRKHVNQFEQELIQALSQTIVCEKLAAFVKTAIHVFFHNNLYQATKLFLSRAQGSFGLVTASTLSEATLVVSAWGQPIATGFNVQDDYMVYASEPAAVDAVLSHIPRSYRLDLDQKGGEIAWVGVNHITVYSMLEDRELRSSELEERWIPLQGNSYILPPEKHAVDPVQRDIQEIPKILKSIEQSWDDPTSFNRQTADYFVELLIEKAKNLKLERVTDTPAIDLLITGVESSLWLGERFAQDLVLICPAMIVKTISSNQLLQRLQYDGSLRLGKTSIVLAISQSGQTFPTLQATNALEELRQQGNIREFFILTGEMCSLMGTAISQYYYQESSFTRRIFINGSGRRTAEPTTVAIAAAQATLTELLLYIAKQLTHQGAFGMTLSTADVLMLERMKIDFPTRAEAIVGITAKGEINRSSDYSQLIQSSKKWAQHIIEAPLVWAIHALYIVVTVGFGIPLVQTVCWIIFGFANLSIPGFLLPLLIVADILIYIFGPWLWSLALRYFQHRPLLARTGKRSVLIGDAPWIHQLLRCYVSKLFSLSYGIASLEVHGGNPQDHMLHHYGHRVVRGSLIFLGIPDGRRSPMQKESESAIVMSGKQAIGVQNLSTGAEIIALGHDPAIAHQSFQAAIVLSSSNLDASCDRQIALEELRESRFTGFERLLASYVFFWAMAKQVASFPLLQYQHWKSQSRTRIMTTAAPVSRATVDRSKRSMERSEV
ncbi:hypothetical protein [Leptolyngbya sp. NIES-2104]|uniref:hypothetical protein n=1 Tax=Leptolyngbya sp. NIES-2104 TaxID=1552121 RepID=UPI0006EC9DFC|nr:hypothetical protein [Leptolyngbya sp. NIES-2104]GAP94307.1 hypothetical protein NIES2104_08180 [Leptolyngbya sp. NIES-2104]